MVSSGPRFSGELGGFSMTTSEQTQVTVLGKVVGIYRQCVHCEEWKLLEHFLLRTGDRGATVRASLRVCHRCRREFGPTRLD